MNIQEILMDPQLHIDVCKVCADNPMDQFPERAFGSIVIREMRKKRTAVPILAQWKQIQLVSMRTQV